MSNAKAETKSQYEFTFIPDKPTEIDAFPNKGHSKTAKALADAVKDIKDRDGAIGLEGSWGSGKSSVIEQMEDQLENISKDTKFHVFTFDLWAHHVDEFKKAFLEVFLQHIENNVELIDKIDVEDKRNEFGCKTRTETIQPNHIFSWSAIIFILFSPFFAACLIWSSPLAFSNKNFDNTPWGYFIAPILAVSYIVFVITTIAVQKISKEENDKLKNNSKLDRLQRKASKALSMFKRESLIAKETTKINEKDPTTLEFYKVFRETLEEIQKDDNRIIFVLDNIDRLPKEDVVNIWAEIRALFSNTTFKPEEDDSNITVIIPYDKAFIKNCFNNKENTSADKINEDTNNCHGTNLIQKTFAQTVRVPPTVMVDWQDFLKQKLKDAFSPEISEIDCAELERIFKRYFDHKNSHPMPREIISFINGIGSLYRIWEDEYNLSVYALYYLFRDEFEGKIVEITKCNETYKEYIDLMRTKDLVLPFGSIYYNVGEETAKELTLKPQIRFALESGDEKRTSELDKHSAFLPLLLDTVKDHSKDWANDTKELFEATKILATLDLPDYHKNRIWEDISVVTTNEHIDFKETHILESYKNILKNHSEPERIFANIIKQLSNLDNEVLGFDAGEKWSIFVNETYRIIDKERNLSKETKSSLLKKLELPKEQQVLLGALHELNVANEVSLNKLDKNISSETLYEGLTAYLDKDKYNTIEQFPPIYEESHKQISKEHKENMVKRICHIFEKEKTDLEPLASLVEILDMTLDDLSYNADLIRQTHHTGILHHILKILKENNYLEIASKIHSLIFMFNTEKSIPTHTPDNTVYGDKNQIKDWYPSLLNKNDEFDYVENLRKEVVNKVNVTDIFDATNKAPEDDDLFSILAKSIIENAAEEYQYLNIFKAINLFDVIESYIQDNNVKEQFLNEIGEHIDESELNEKFTEDFIKSIPHSFIKAISETAVQSIHPIIKNIDAYLQSIEPQNWIEHFTNNSSEFNILYLRYEHGNKVNILGQIDLKEIYFNIALQTLEGKTNLPNVNRVIAFKNNLNKSQFKNLLSDIANKLKDIVVINEGALKFFETFRENINSFPFDKNYNTTVSKLLIHLISSKEDKHYDILMSLNLPNTKTLNEDKLTELESIISEKENTEDAAQINKAKAIREKLNLTKPKPKEDKAKDEELDQTDINDNQ